jgi:ABC-type amino acid transport substrate-binding protein
LPRPVPPRDWLERLAQDRGADLRLIDRLVDQRTEPPPFKRQPLPPRPPDVQIAEGVALLADTDPFVPEPALEPKEVTIRVALLRSTYKTREREEVLAAAQPFIDLVQREVNVRGAPDLLETPDEAFYALAEGKDQMLISHVFDYLLIHSWFADMPNNGSVLLGWAEPAHARTADLDRDLPGVPGTSLELVVAADSPYQSFADLRGKRLALAANDTCGPGTVLTRLLADAGQPKDQPFFGRVTLRRYPKDVVIDVLKGQADAACVDQGTIGAVTRFYGVGSKLRTLAVSPRYNMDVLYTSVNNLATHRTEIELTQRQLNTLGKNPEGQEVLFLFDQAGWHFYREGDILVARENFADFIKFLNETPVDLRPLLDPHAPVDRHTYDRYGDE